MSIPNIRFKGFTDDWEQRKLGDMLERYEDPVETPHDGYERIGIRSHAKGVFHGYVEPGKELDTAKMHRVAADKFILNITFAWEHAVAITEEEDAGTLVSHRFPQFSFHKELKSHFFKFLMLDRKFREYLELCSPGGAGRNRVLNINDMLKYKINVPSVEEQTKIGEYFDNLDNLITLHQRKPLTNSYYINPWEQRKLGELMDVTSVKRIHQSDWTDSGIRFLRARDIVAESKNEEVTEPLFISEEKYEEYSALSGKVKPGDLLVTGVGTIGVPMLIKSDEPVYFKDGNIIWFKNENTIDGKFFYHSFNGEGVQKFIKESAGIGTVGTYTIDSGKKTPINLPPSKEEQSKIGEDFDDLDNLITLHRRMFISQKRRAYKCIKRQ